MEGRSRCIESSGTGTLCAECSFRGYIGSNDTGCVCTSPQFDPSLSCLIPDEEVEIDVYLQILSNATCTCYTSFDFGFWTLGQPSSTLRLGPTPDDEARHLYGTDGPAVCDACVSDLYGPKPFTFTYSAEEKGSRGCAVFGGPDPNQVFLEGVENIATLPEINQ
jgi:hypothetical protein